MTPREKPLKLLVDRRIGGVERYYFGREDERLMQVPDEMRKCALFVGYRTRPENDPIITGTAFLIGVPTGGGTGIQYVVTARHLLDRMDERVPGISTMLLRMNMTGGKAKWIDFEMSNWQYHEDRSVDLAVAELPLDRETDHLCYRSEGFATPDVIALEGIGPADAVAIIGLFSVHPGEERNIPVVRVGNIAAMPERVFRQNVGTKEGYLVEARSIEGLSGSPVFVHVAPLRINRPAERNLDWKYYLLGLMHGYFHTAEGDSTTDRDRGERFNTGISLVVPVDRIIEVLSYERFKGPRDALKAKQDRKRGGITPTNREPPCDGAVVDIVFPVVPKDLCHVLTTDESGRPAAPLTEGGPRPGTAQQSYKLPEGDGL
jgi:hypothetical protein